jgi:hypothetical protein
MSPLGRERRKKRQGSHGKGVWEQEMKKEERTTKPSKPHWGRLKRELRSFRGHFHGSSGKRQGGEFLSRNEVCTPGRRGASDPALGAPLREGSHRDKAEGMIIKKIQQC